MVRRLLFRQKLTLELLSAKIQGDVMAKEKINLLAPGSISGSLNTPQLSVETGGIINGRVSMDT